jgi:hypothetical protein
MAESVDNSNSILNSTGMSGISDLELPAPPELKDPKYYKNNAKNRENIEPLTFSKDHKDLTSRIRNYADNELKVFFI